MFFFEKNIHNFMANKIQICIFRRTFTAKVSGYFMPEKTNTSHKRQKFACHYPKTLWPQALCPNSNTY